MLQPLERSKARLKRALCRKAAQGKDLKTSHKQKGERQIGCSGASG
jgi:hypothetical protein